MNGQVEGVLIVCGVLLLCIMGICASGFALILSEVFNLTQMTRGVLTIIYFFILIGYFFYSSNRRAKKFSKEFADKLKKREADFSRWNLRRLASDWPGSRANIQKEIERESRRQQHLLDISSGKEPSKYMKKTIQKYS